MIYLIYAIIGVIVGTLYALTFKDNIYDDDGSWVGIGIMSGILWPLSILSTIIFIFYKKYLKKYIKRFLRNKDYEF